MFYRPLSLLQFVLYTFIISTELVAEVKIVDGDTISINGEKVRLSGIDAPENSQLCLNSQKESYPCGIRATQKLFQLIASSQSKSVECKFSGSDNYGRLIGNCWVDGIFINSWLVRNGWALAYRKYSKEFIEEEMDARKKKSGIWSGTFIEPWKWRQGFRLSSDLISTRKGCSIKGNISFKGEKIFHIPGGQYYTITKITQSKGEKWFCSEQEAKVAGWRKSKK